MSEETRTEFDPSRYIFTDPGAPTAIRSRTVLPARRENFEVTTADGKRLVGELALPEGDVKATLVTFHPLPTHGGYMDSHVYKKASFRLPALANIAVLRFNTRGTSSIRGTSDGVFDGGFAEKKDFDAILDYVLGRALPNPWLIGWSFGTELVLKYGPARANEFTPVRFSSPRRFTGYTRRRWLNGIRSATPCMHSSLNTTTTYSPLRRVNGLVPLTVPR